MLESMAPQINNNSAYSTANSSGTTRCGNDSIVWNSASSAKESSLFLIDWDDTLLCSSWLSARNLRLDTQEIPYDVRIELRKLENSIIMILTQALELGSVAIVTNAEHGWVELSAQKFVPGVTKILSQLRIISARTEFQDQFPTQVGLWKKLAYNAIFAEIFGDGGGNDNNNNKNVKAYNLISLGDAIFERDALIDLAKQVPNALGKSVKFVEKPSLNQILKQLDIVSNHLSVVYNASQDIDLMLTIEYLDA